MNSQKSADREASRKNLSPMLVALAAMFGQQTFASVGKTLPAIVAPLVLAELGADAAWVGIYFGLSAAASLIAQMGCGSFIIRYGALRMSQVALVLLGGGMAAAAEGGLLGFGASAVSAAAARRSRRRPARNCSAGCRRRASRRWCFRSSRPRCRPGCCSPGFSARRWRRPGDGAARCWRPAPPASPAAVMLQPLRARFDDDRVPSRRFRLSDFRARSRRW